MKKIITLLMAVVLAVSFTGVSAFAWTASGSIEFTGAVLDADGDSVESDYGITAALGSVKGDSVRPGKKIYFEIGDSSTNGTGGLPIEADALADGDLFTFKLDRDQNGSLLESVKLVYKNLDGNGRKNYVEVVLKDSTKVDERKISFEVYFKAKKDDPDNAPELWSSGDIISAYFSLWVDNEHVDGEDADVDTGEGVVFKPVSNERNTITWGGNEEVASLTFDAGSSADKFYAKLSTKTDQDIYRDYGDPVDADLYFRTFVGNPSIDSTSRGTLTLYNPWSDYYDDYDDRYDFDPREAYIYLVDSDGYLEDVTGNFTYADEDKTEAGIDGWQVRVRSLGSYVISDTRLDIDDGFYDEPVDYPETAPAPAPKPGPAPAPTGSHDFLALSGMLAVLSAGAIVLARKRH